MKIPFINLKIQHHRLKKDIMAMWADILDSSCFVGGLQISAFETEFARACSVKHCVAVNSGTDALRFILLAIDLKPGDEVITVPNTFIATTEAITQAGGKVVFVEIDPDSYTMDPQKLETAITSKTKAIIPVHLYGHMADMDPILGVAEKYGLAVVEDACQAHLAEYKGHKAGSLGIAGAFSFYPGKNLGACGEGGAVTTNNAALAQRIRMIRDHGQLNKYHHEIEGYNGRLDALQAAALRIKLKYIEEWNEARRKNTLTYLKYLKNLEEVRLPKMSTDCLPVFHLFVIQVNNRDKVSEILGQKGIGTGIHYPIPLHLQHAYRHMNLPRGSFPIAEACADRILSLPMYPELTESHIRKVSASLKQVIYELNGFQSELTSVTGR